MRLTHKQCRSKVASQKGGVFISSLIVIFLSSALVASFLSLSMNETRTVRMDIERQKAELAAEAGLDYGITKLREIIFNYRFNPATSRSALQAQLDNIPPPPQQGPYLYQTPAGQNGFRIIVESPVFQGMVTGGSAFRGANATIQQFSIVSGAYEPDSGAYSVLRQDVQAIGMALIRFGVFYENDLEIQPGPSMVFEGPVHSNADMYIGGPLEFHDRVTAFGNIVHRRKNDGTRHGQARAYDENYVLRSFRSPDGSWVDSDNPDWMLESISRWDGTIQSRDHGISRLSPPISPLDSPYAIIQRPLPATNSNYSATTEAEKFSNKAGLRLHIDAQGNLSAKDAMGNNVTDRFTPAELQMADGVPLKDDDRKYVFDEPGTHEISDSRFYDAREDRWVSPVDIYVDQLQKEYPELYASSASGSGQGIIYVTRDAADDGSMPAVRLRNASSLKNEHGMSIVSDLPMYVEGDFNTTDTVPALVAGDAVTFLSRNWQDADSDGGQNDRRAEDTDFNAVVMTGNTETTWGNYNGGLENVLRFLEHWSGRTVGFRGSIVCLWNSQIADAPWVFGSQDGRFRYTAPNRDWGYDSIYRNQAPPGMTYVFGMEEVLWTRTSWDQLNW